MATTVKHQPPTNQYIVVVNSTSDDFFLQNVGQEAVMIVWAASVPAADTKGHILQPGESVVRDLFTGLVYARSITRETVVVVTS